MNVDFFTAVVNKMTLPGHSENVKCSRNENVINVKAIVFSVLAFAVLILLILVQWHP